MKTYLRSNLVLILLLLATGSRAQTGNVTNAVVNVTPGTVVISNGGIVIQNSGAIDNSGDFRLKGDWTNDARGLINSSPGVVEFNGTTNQKIGGTVPTDFYNLTVSNPTDVTLNNNENVQSALKFNSGKINTGADTLSLTAATPVPVTGAGTNSYVNGNLRIAVPAGNSSVKYEIGSGVYAPATLDLNGVANAGRITGTTVTGAEPNENNPIPNASGINQNAKVNQYWVMSNSAAAFSNYDITFDFTNTSNTGNPAKYMVSKFSAPSTWAPATSSVAGTTIKATGLNSFSEFEVGEPTITMVENLEASNSAEVFPNPVQNKMTVKINSLSSTNSLLKLTDMTGRTLLSKSIQVERGINYFQLNVGGLASGLYTVSVENEQRIQNVRIAVQ